MQLPDDFSAVLGKVEQSGILDEDPQLVDNRLSLAVQSAALVSGQRDLSDLAMGDWTLGAVKKLKRAVHNEICDQEKKTLKQSYADLLGKGLTPEGITAVSTVVVGVISLVNPAFAVSNVVIFIAIWVLKRGLTSWCSVREA